MAFTVQDFYSKLAYGGARQNLFEVVLPFPAVSGGTALMEQFSFMCKSASLPAEELGTITVPYFGRQIKLAGDRTFGDWTVTVINDEDFSLRDVFEQWSNALNGHFNNLRDTNARATASYQTDATIIQYGKTGDTIKSYTMVGAYPSAVSAIDTAWEANDQIEEFQVTFQYQWWTARTTV